MSINWGEFTWGYPYWYSTLTVQYILSKLPHYYNKYEKSQLYCFIKAIADEYDVAYNNYISRLGRCLSIDDTLDSDLDWKWGHLFNTKQMPGESAATYRQRLSNILNSLIGGTKDSVYYAVMVGLGLLSNPDAASRCISIYDGWKYTGPGSTPDMLMDGNVVCSLSFTDANDRSIYYDGIENDIIDIMSKSVAAGIVPHVVIGYTTYGELTKFTYGQLSAYTYDSIRKWGTE